MPDEKDPRYRGSGPPSLEQLRALLRCSTVESKRSPDGKYSRIIFHIDNEKLYESGQSYFGTDSQIMAGFLEIMDRITEFEDITRRYADNITGVTCDDLKGWLEHQKKYVHSGVEAVITKRMFDETIRKLEELKEWRRAADQKRREREQAARAEAKRQREEREKENAKARAEAERERARQEGMWQQRRREREEAYRRESAAGSDSGAKSRRSGMEGDFSQDFKDAFGMGYEEWARRYQQDFRDSMGGNPFEELFRRAYGGRSGPNGGQHRQGEQEQEKARPKARNKTRAPWFEVLEISPKANAAEIKKAWRKKISALHPDRITDPKEKLEATEKMKDLNTAKDEGIRGLA